MNRKFDDILAKEVLSETDIVQIKTFFMLGFSATDPERIIQTEADLDFLNRQEFEPTPELWEKQKKKLLSYLFTAKGAFTVKAQKSGFMDCDREIIEKHTFVSIIGFSSKRYAWQSFIGEPVYCLDYLGKTLQYCFEDGKITYLRRFGYE